MLGFAVLDDVIGLSYLEGVGLGLRLEILCAVTGRSYFLDVLVPLFHGGFSVDADPLLEPRRGRVPLLDHAFRGPLGLGLAGR